MTGTLAAIICLLPQTGAHTTTKPTDPIGPPPAALSYSGFYTKCAYFRGLPILASDKVDERAIRVLIDRLKKSLRNVPVDWTDELIKAGGHYSIIAETEGQTDLPEYADLRNDPNTDWNKRARGLGGLYVSAGEENILESPGDRYKGECIYLHEFAHTLDEYVFSKKDMTFRADLNAAYKDALKQGLWKNTYSATNPAEYFAEGVQMYFDCARRAVPANGVHNEISNRVGLMKYDPALYKIVDRVYHHNSWRYEGSYNKSKEPQGLTPG